MKKQEIILLVNNLSVGLGRRDIIINEENNVLRLPHLYISTPNSNNSEIDLSPLSFTNGGSQGGQRWT